MKNLFMRFRLFSDKYYVIMVHKEYNPKSVYNIMFTYFYLEFDDKPEFVIRNKNHWCEKFSLPLYNLHSVALVKSLMRKHHFPFQQTFFSFVIL